MLPRLMHRSVSVPVSSPSDDFLGSRALANARVNLGRAASHGGIPSFRLHSLGSPGCVRTPKDLILRQYPGNQTS